MKKRRVIKKPPIMFGQRKSVKKVLYIKRMLIPIRTVIIGIDKCIIDRHGKHIFDSQNNAETKNGPYYKIGCKSFLNNPPYNKENNEYINRDYKDYRADFSHENHASPIGWD